MKTDLPVKLQLILKALRDTENKQTKTSLQDNKGYCCLGLMCKVAENNGVELNYASDTFISGGSLMDQLEVENWTGLHRFGFFDTNTVFFKDSVKRKIMDIAPSSLAELNDISNFTFAEIADFIEGNWEQLFENNIKEPL